jgi:hypothetical protein
MPDLVIIPTAVLAGPGAVFYQGIAGAAITAGQAVTLDAASKQLTLADSNAAVELATVKGIALHAASTGQPLRIQTNGTITLGGTTVGMIYVLSGTPGGIAPVAELVAGMYTSILGVGAASGTLKLSLSNSGQQVAV